MVWYSKLQKAAVGCSRSAAGLHREYTFSTSTVSTAIVCRPCAALHKSAGDCSRWPWVYWWLQGMADLYRIKLESLECLLKSNIELLKPSCHYQSQYGLDDYLSGFLRDRDRSQIYYCDPMLQHISICRQFLSLLDGSNTIEFEWVSA